MAVSWKDYVGLRGINQKQHFSTHNIKTYVEFLALINKGDVVPPPESEVACFFIKESAPQVKKAPSVKSETASKPKKPTPVKSSRKTDISKRAAKPRSRKSSSRKKSSEKS